MIVRAFIVPKAGWSVDDCQDAYAISRSRRRFAVVDGMTDSALSAEWARLLASHLVEMSHWDRPSLLTATNTLAEDWHALAPTDDVPWYLSRKISERGAYATVAALDLTRTGRGRTYRMLGVGDTCIFHVRGGRLIRAHPYSDAADFQHRPLGLGTLATAANEQVLKATGLRYGTWRRGDRFLIMSDALAAYVLGAVAQCHGVRRALAFDRTPPAYSRWVETMRNAGRLKDDDTTLLEVIT